METGGSRRKDSYRTTREHFHGLLTSRRGTCSAPFPPQSTPPTGPFGFLLNTWLVTQVSDTGTATLGVMNFDGAGNVIGPPDLPTWGYQHESGASRRRDSHRNLFH